QMKAFFISASVSILTLISLTAVAVAQSDVPDGGVPQANDGINDALVVGNRCYVAGAFTNFGGVPRTGLAAFDIITGQVDMAWNPSPGGPTTFGTPLILGLESDGTWLYFTGDFTTVNGSVTRNRLAAVELANGSNTGLVEPTWDPNLDFFGVDLAKDGSKLYVLGGFSSVNGSTPRHGLAAFNLADGVDTGVADVWDPNLTSSGIFGVNAIEISGGVIYIGGFFNAANGTPRNGLVALEPANGSNTGAADPNWDPDITWPGGTFSGFASINELEVSGSLLCVGGQFDTVNGSVTRDNLAAFDLAGGVATGEVDAAWDPDVGDPALGDFASALTITNSQVFVGGSFSQAGGSTRNNAAAFNLPDGGSAAALQSWDPNVMIGGGIIFGPGIGVLTPSGASGLWMGGTFTQIGGIPITHFAGFSSTVPVELSVFAHD
ncbi:hypothetical protein JXA47_10820, partial [Candidatus Sumerlaeota bacterium]|nr:hypothetical protein [Candidatus Sumerlaeota bacterium]